jgi:hypothetical protein
MGERKRFTQVSEHLKTGFQVVRSVVKPTEQQKQWRRQVENAADSAKLDILTNPRASDATANKVLTEIDKNRKKYIMRINRGQNPFGE